MSQPLQDDARLAEPADQARSVSPWPGWLAMFVAAVALYAVTANRGAQWQDSGQHILRAVTGELIHPLGLALAHPLHHWLSRFAVSPGLLEPCVAVTLISSLAAAAAVANTYGCVLTLTRSQAASLLAAGSLGLAHTFWQMATLAETYTLVAALLSAECWCLVNYARTNRRGYLWATLFFNGLGIANHMLAALTAPILVGVLIAVDRSKAAWVRDVLTAIGLWLVGSLPYTALIVADLVHTGSIGETGRSALFGKSFAGEVLNMTVLPRMLLLCAGFIVLNFPNLLLPVAIYGMFRGRRFDVPRTAYRYLVAALIIHVCFVVRYSIVDQHTFLLPTYVLLSIFSGIGFALMLRWPRVRLRRIVLVVASVALAMTPVWYAFVPAIARHFNVLESVARNKPYRDDYVYVFTPWSVAERSAEIMSRHAVELAGQHGLILVEDPMAEFAVRYQAIQAGRDNVEIVRDITSTRIMEAAREGSAVVLVPKRRDAPNTEPPVGSWKRAEDLYTLTGEDAVP